MYSFIEICFGFTELCYWWHVCHWYRYFGLQCQLWDVCLMLLTYADLMSINCYICTCIAGVLQVLYSYSTTFGFWGSCNRRKYNKETPTSSLAAIGGSAINVITWAVRWETGGSQTAQVSGRVLISVATACSRYYYVYLAYLSVWTRTAELAVWMDTGWTVSVPFTVWMLLFIGASTLILGQTKISIQWVPWALLLVVKLP